MHAMLLSYRECRLSSVYGLLRKMRFFKHFLLTRSFRRWRANVKRSAFERTREVLGQLLFGAVPTFQPVMLRAGQLVQAMRETAVVSVRRGVWQRGCRPAIPASRTHARSTGAGVSAPINLCLTATFAPAVPVRALRSPTASTGCTHWKSLWQSRTTAGHR